MKIDDWLMEILACPSDDHAPLRPGTPTDPDADVQQSARTALSKMTPRR